ncbi:MAG: hypothetical protein KAI24_24895 [Planctomycetes bacterium]|nr:hypothetical protein [Planctomycetota bacterium]
MRDNHRQQGEDGGERGSALIFALMFSTIVLGIVLTGTLTLRSQITQNRTMFITSYQAVMAARSGLTEALSWLRRQTSQPVTAFEPVLLPDAVPPILDTEDPDIGLVRDFQISGNLWARYEVWKEWPSDPDADRLAWRVQFQCSDVSGPKTGGSAGTAWRLRSVGYVYRRLDENVAFNVQPNVVLATEMAETDVLRAVINLPGQAALNVADGNSAHINTNGRIRGNSMAGIYYPQGSGTPTTGPKNQNRVTGTPGLSGGATYDDSYEGVFGLTFAELSSMADLIVTDPSEFPVPIPDNSLIVVDIGSTLSIDSAMPLTGSGLVVVNGNMTMTSGNNSLFSGMLYVDGNFTMRAPSEINGSVVATGNMTLQGSGDYATINYDEAALSALMTNFGSYRRVNSIYLPRRSN